MSSAFSRISVALALKAMNVAIGKDPGWSPDNPDQTQLFRDLEVLLPRANQLSEFAAYAATSAKTLNHLLDKAGYDIRLAPWPDNGNNIGAISIANLSMRWREPGSIMRSGQPLTINGSPAFLLRGDQVTYYANRDQPLKACVRLANGDTLNVAPFVHPSEPTGYTFNSIIESIEATRGSQVGKDGLLMPMMSLNVTSQLDWLIGMSSDRNWTVTQAMQEVAFKMNHLGASAKVGTAIAATRGKPHYFTIDGPCVLWVERHGVTLFAAYVTEDAWMDPGDLG